MSINKLTKWKAIKTFKDVKRGRVYIRPWSCFLMLLPRIRLQWACETVVGKAGARDRELGVNMELVPAPLACLPLDFSTHLNIDSELYTY